MKLEELTKEQLIEEVKKLKSRKKFGLVWENKPELVEERCKKEIPVLEEVKERELKKRIGGPYNLLIEGDNYHALSVLNYTHKEKVDAIYIDPPYNTGKKDFIYNDSYVDKEDAYKHSKWLSFMYKRLSLAKNLLNQKGVIFISIDDNEQPFLRIICDDVFGKENFVEQVIWKKRATPPNDRIIGRNHEYILIYGKSSDYELSLLPRTSESLKRYKNPDNDKNGPWAMSDLSANGKGGRLVQSCVFPIFNPEKGKNYMPPDGKCWLYNREKTNKYLEEGRISFRKSGTPFLKRYLSEVKTGQTAPTIWVDAGFSQDSAKEIKDIFNGEVLFENPKPLKLIKRIIQIASPKKDAIILDFFAGSGTTGQAVIEMNKQDGGSRRFILCTNNENKIAESVCYTRVANTIRGHAKREGIPANLKYFKTAFVPKNKVSDDTRTELVQKSTEMICVREGTFEELFVSDKYKIFRDTIHTTAILFDLDWLNELKEKLNALKVPSSIYVFSLSNDTYDSDFEDLEIEHELCPIPESILEVYRKLFKE